ncbi:hypothetical protein DES53_101340 [Roseimicrobium gellanilyticum]|uniref:Uncharacterized protein n=1 Tax=Roseimicrobium gellanilyticum TaxID=748857 RepID=A0A366HTD7_9BACT|nr:zinc ABC transporter substrate-binding protein [Roseimicrobium gellanilyticum]RBP47543.1 hypothetical protein DES53_101340 [Roseimicrobium gellanilyticum]
MTSAKQEIYEFMLRRTLPHLRNVASLGWWRRMRDRSAYYEAELIHNLPNSMYKPEFVEHDIHFLNWQARWYCEKCDVKLSSMYPQQVGLIRGLFALVPPEMRSQLKWSGP